MSPKIYIPLNSFDRFVLKIVFYTSHAYLKDILKLHCTENKAIFLIYLSCYTQKMFKEEPENEKFLNSPYDAHQEELRRIIYDLSNTLKIMKRNANKSPLPNKKAEIFRNLLSIANEVTFKLLMITFAVGVFPEKDEDVCKLWLDLREGLPNVPNILKTLREIDEGIRNVQNVNTHPMEKYIFFGLSDKDIIKSCQYVPEFIKKCDAR